MVTDVLLANILTASAIWGMVQFHRHDYHAPWSAYLAVILPAAFLVLSAIASDGLPPHFDALAAFLK